MSTTTTITTTCAPGANFTASADYPTISYVKLLAGDANESLAIHQACQRDGFCYLDLSTPGHEPNPITQGVQSAFKIAKEFFDLEDEEKLKFDIDAIGPWKLNGYVPSLMPKYSTTKPY